jgi:DNA-directed RNA polymerase subunit K/omega
VEEHSGAYDLAFRRAFEIDSGAQKGQKEECNKRVEIGGN